MNNDKRVRVNAVFLIVFMVVQALTGSMYSNLLPEIIRSYSLDLRGASLIGSFSSIGGITALLVSFFWLDGVDKHWQICVLLMSFGLAMFAIGSRPSYLLLLAIMTVYGFSSILVDNLCSTYMSDLYGERRGKPVSILHAFFAAGSMIGPKFAVLFLTGISSWGDAYRIVALVLIGLDFLFLLVNGILGRPVPAVLPHAGKKEGLQLKTILSNKRILWLSIASILMSGGFYINTWAPTYLQSLDADRFSPAFCANLMVFAYIGMLISRTVFGAVSRKIGPENYLKWSSLASAVIIVLLVSIPSRAVWVCGILLYGIVNGAQYTAKFLIAFEEMPEHSGAVGAAVGIGSSIGGTIFSYIISSVADRFNFTAAMYLPAVVMFATFLVVSATLTRKEGTE